jgi:hypothetical protein
MLSCVEAISVYDFVNLANDKGHVFDVRSLYLAHRYDLGVYIHKT